MKNATSYSLNLAVAALLVLASATIAAALGTDTCAGSNATIGGTCTPLTNSASGDNEDTALGLNALIDNSTGSQNTATGAVALQGNTTGSNNTGTGVSALQNNDTGSNNTATGENALQFSTGSSNIAIGASAALNLTTGDNNIDIGNPGAGSESGTIRIGTQGTQTATFIAGIFGGPKIKKGCDVVAQSNGLLGCMKSSARYKRDIRDMGDASDKLMKLRPVTFQYKEDSDGIQQYGLIAEEVEKVYPELVVDGPDGKAETVEYQVLPAMLLNEVQKERRDSERKSAQIAALTAQIAKMKASMRQQNVAFEERLSRIEQTMVSRDSGRNIAAAFNR
jgi:Chaperone of endosialidase